MNAKPAPFIELSTKVVALESDPVEVLNYKRRPPRWEAGKVASVETHWIIRGPINHYTVFLERLSPRGQFLRLTVGDDGIRPAAARALQREQAEQEETQA